MLEIVLEIPLWLEAVAVFACAIIGAMAAVQEDYDIFGTVAVGMITGLGGGILRDLLLQDYGIYAFSEPHIIAVAVTASVFVFYFHKLSCEIPYLLDFLDNLAMASWSIVAVGKGLSAGLDIVPAIVLGFITACGGGILRDIIMNRKPAAFMPGTLYGSAALAGCATYAILAQSPEFKPYAAITCAAMVFILRYAAILFDWQTRPAEADFSHLVIDPVKTISQQAAKPFEMIIHPEAFMDDNSGSKMGLTSPEEAAATPSRNDAQNADSPAHVSQTPPTNSDQ